MKLLPAEDHRTDDNSTLVQAMLGSADSFGIIPNLDHARLDTAQTTSFFNYLSTTQLVWCLLIKVIIVFDFALLLQSYVHYIIAVQLSTKQ